MLFMFIALTTMAAILVFTDYRNSSTRWGSAFLFFAGSGALGKVLTESLIPYIHEGFWKSVMIGVSCFLFAASFQWSPYALLMYSIKYSGLLRKYKRFDGIMKYIFVIPVIITYFVTDLYPDYDTNFVFLSIWGVPYTLASNFFLIYSAVVEKNERIKYQRIYTCAVLTPPSLFSMVTIYVIRIFGIHNLWQYNTLFILLGFTVFLASAAKYGVMGVKIKSEQTRIENTIKAVSSGTAILNHTLKNEIMKISLCISNVRDSIESSGVDIKDADENIEVVRESIVYLNSFIKRINEHIGEIKLKEDVYDLGRIVNRSVDAIVYNKERSNIKVIAELDFGLQIKCDCVHLEECFRNILKNAVESMTDGGTLTLKLNETKKYIIISIMDTGSGISKQNLKHIFEPFFTTKSKTMNFGLGLPYCYSVIKMHNGELEIQSEEGKGTKVFISLPKSRIVNYKNELTLRSLTNE
ncbi:MAG: sensor histidine kinase [Bacillota bacterium]